LHVLSDTIATCPAPPALHAALAQTRELLTHRIALSLLESAAPPPSTSTFSASSVAASGAVTSVSSTDSTAAATEGGGAGAEQDTDSSAVHSLGGTLRCLLSPILAAATAAAEAAATTPLVDQKIVDVNLACAGIFLQPSSVFLSPAALASHAPQQQQVQQTARVCAHSAAFLRELDSRLGLLAVQLEERCLRGLAHSAVWCTPGPLFVYAQSISNAHQSTDKSRSPWWPCMVIALSTNGAGNSPFYMHPDIVRANIRRLPAEIVKQLNKLRPRTAQTSTTAVSGAGAGAAAGDSNESTDSTNGTAAAAGKINCLQHKFLK
jgi:hypothetical protein